VRDGDEGAWAAFDEALRGTEQAQPQPGLRERCLPFAAGVEGLADAAEAHAGRGLASRRCLILAAEDEPNIRRLISVQLSRSGHEVVAVEDGLLALEAAGRLLPDLIILDVMMPGLNGFEVLERLKADPRTASIPVVMLTAKSGDDHIRHGWHAGTDFYMPKPFNPEELRSVVERITAPLGTPENPPPLRRWLK
jgi:CheY-like chemotaxis protein